MGLWWQGTGVSIQRWQFRLANLGVLHDHVKAKDSNMPLVEYGNEKRRLDSLQVWISTAGATIGMMLTASTNLDLSLLRLASECEILFD